MRSYRLKMVFVHLYLVRLNSVMPFIVRREIEYDEEKNMSDLLEFERIDLNFDVVEDLINSPEVHHFSSHNSNEIHWISYDRGLLMNEDQLPSTIELKGNEQL